MPGRFRPLAVLLLLTATLLTTSEALAMPAFARKYKMGCNMCHTIYPQLNRFGRDFRDNGFRMPEEVQTLLKRSGAPSVPPAAPAPDQDFWSFIPSEVPLAVQAKVHNVLNPKGDVKSDFQIEELQLQAAGTWTPRVSYYLHHHLAEEGEPGELYTGWVRFNNLAGSDWLNVTAGQVELPLSFSPEIERLSVFQYLVYDRTVGLNRFTLSTPQLGLQYFGQSRRGTKLWVGIANGSGLSVNEETETFDSNSFKDVYGRVTQEIGESYVGGFAYVGRRGAASATDPFKDDFVRVGGDGLIQLGRLNLYGSALYARDSNALGIGERRSLWGGFVQGDLFVSDRAVLLVRFDGVHEKAPVFIVDEDEDEEGTAREPFRVNTFAVTPGVQYLARPNVKLGAEYQIRQSRREDRAIALLHVSF